MIKKLVCFDADSLRHLDLLMNLFQMNRSQIIRYLLRERVDGIARTQFSLPSNRNNSVKQKDLPVGGDKK